MQFILLQKCHDGKTGDWNLNCIEHQFSGWSCKPCVDCDGTPCDKYWTAQVGEPPLFAHAMLGNGQCDQGQPFDGGSSAPQKRLNWKCEEFKFDLFVLPYLLLLCFTIMMSHEHLLIESQNAF